MRFEQLENEDEFRTLASAKVEHRPQMEFIVVDDKLVAVRIGRIRIGASTGVGLNVWKEIDTQW